MHERGQGPNFASICNDDFGEKKLMLQQKPTHKLPLPLAACPLSVAPAQPRHPRAGQMRAPVPAAP